MHEDPRTALACVWRGMVSFSFILVSLSLRPSHAQTKEAPGRSSGAGLVRPEGTCKRPEVLSNCRV